MRKARSIKANEADLRRKRKKKKEDKDETLNDKKTWRDHNRQSQNSISLRFDIT